MNQQNQIAIDESEKLNKPAIEQELNALQECLCAIFYAAYYKTSMPAVSLDENTFLAWKALTDYVRLLINKNGENNCKKSIEPEPELELATEQTEQKLKKKLEDKLYELFMKGFLNHKRKNLRDAVDDGIKTVTDYVMPLINKHGREGNNEPKEAKE